MAYYYKRTDELYHHGILGQKWGIRRFQNKDGSLTPAGKERYERSTFERSYQTDGAISKTKSIPMTKRKSYGDENVFESEEIKVRDSTGKNDTIQFLAFSKSDQLNESSHKLMNNLVKSWPEHDKILRKAAITGTESRKYGFENDLKGMSHPIITINEDGFPNIIEVSYDGGKDMGWHMIDCEYDYIRRKPSYWAING